MTDTSIGYICIDGTSLTVCQVGDDWFSIMLVPYTQSQITLPGKSVGQAVNLEVDIVGKYVEKILLERGEKALREQPQIVVDAVNEAVRNDYS